MGWGRGHVRGRSTGAKSGANENSLYYLYNPYTDEAKVQPGLKLKIRAPPSDKLTTGPFIELKALREQIAAQGYLQVVSIDPARVNLALRIERRHLSGKIEPVVFEKVDISDKKNDHNNANDTKTPNARVGLYNTLTRFLDAYQEYYKHCQLFIVERQLPINYKAVRIAQHIISYFSLRLANAPVQPLIVEINPKIKTRQLGGYVSGNPKKWAVETSRRLLEIRGDQLSLTKMNSMKSKQDDLADTVCQIEALCSLWGLMTTPLPTIGNIPVMLRFGSALMPTPRAPVPTILQQMLPLLTSPVVNTVKLKITK